jgi:Protein of unknown function (DUF2798)
MKINKLDLQFALLMSSVTTFFVTFVLVAVNLGFTERFLFVWMRSWAIAATMVALSILFVAPKIRKFLTK